MPCQVRFPAVLDMNEYMKLGASAEEAAAGAATAHEVAISEERARLTADAPEGDAAAAAAAAAAALAALELPDLVDVTGAKAPSQVAEELEAAAAGFSEDSEADPAELVRTKVGPFPEDSEADPAELVRTKVGPFPEDGGS